MQREQISLYFRSTPANHEEEKQLVNNLAIIKSQYPNLILASEVPFKLMGFEIQPASAASGHIIFSDHFFWTGQINLSKSNYCYFEQVDEPSSELNLFYWKEKKLIPAPSSSTEGLIPYGIYSENAKYQLIFERPKNLFQEYVESPYTKKALFMDRDGIIIEDTHYPHKVEDLKIRPDAIEMMVRARKAGYKLILLSNQAGVAKEKFSYNQMKLFHQELERQLQKYFGIELDDAFYCPFHSEGTVEGFVEDSFDRKPQLGMLLKATQKHKINLRQSIMVGDKASDNFFITGLKFYLLKSEYCQKHPNLIHSLDDIPFGASTS